MINIKQIVDGKTIYQDKIEKYDYDVPTFLRNGATEVIIKYPTSTIIITPDLEKV